VVCGGEGAVQVDAGVAVGTSTLSYRRQARLPFQSIQGCSRRRAQPLVIHLMKSRPSASTLTMDGTPLSGMSCHAMPSIRIGRVSCTCPSISAMYSDCDGGPLNSLMELVDNVIRHV